MVELVASQPDVKAAPAALLPEAGSGDADQLRWRYRCTAAYCVSFVGLGLMPCVYGPTLPALAARVGLSGPADLASTFIARGVFYGAGTLVAGSLVDRVGAHAHRLWAAAALAMAVCGAALPLGGSLAQLTVLVGGLNLAAGVVDVLGNVRNNSKPLRNRSTELTYTPVLLSSSRCC